MDLKMVTKTGALISSELQKNKAYTAFQQIIITFDIVSESGSSMGSAQSTIMSQPQTRILPDDNRRLAKDAALCDSYSRNANPLFFFFESSGEL